LEVMDVLGIGLFFLSSDLGLTSHQVNPSQWWISGVLAAALHNQPIQCTSTETAKFDPPPGQTCSSYAGAFAQTAGGYLLNPTASAECQYCPYSNADQYLATLNISADQKWRDFGIFLIFVFTNWLLVYFFIYTTKIRGWSFGLGYLSTGLGKTVDGIKGLFKRKNKEEASA